MNDAYHSKKTPRRETTTERNGQKAMLRAARFQKLSWSARETWSSVRSRANFLGYCQLYGMTKKNPTLKATCWCPIKPLRRAKLDVCVPLSTCGYNQGKHVTRAGIFCMVPWGTLAMQSNQKAGPWSIYIDDLVMIWVCEYSELPVLSPFGFQNLCLRNLQCGSCHLYWRCERVCPL